MGLYWLNLHSKMSTLYQLRVLGDRPRNGEGIRYGYAHLKEGLVRVPKGKGLVRVTEGQGGSQSDPQSRVAKSRGHV